MVNQPFPIVHFATHAKIESGKPNHSYIQLWDEQLNLNQFANYRSPYNKRNWRY
ncbi:hypothetical protein [Dactylococcopsis salina]|uniref:hypothetical protein n=1 Tax=Dactylococcopsis salina TaxID=292566 RepID=UPI0002E449EB|nr:hypothetical protein [Dactylococcopsis salina]